MRAQIRLADRQGLFTGRHLCSAQVSMSYYRIVEEQAEQRDRDVQEFRYALLGASGHVPFAELFPEIAQQVNTDDSTELEDREHEDETVTYKFSEQPPLSPEQMERELAALLANDQDLTANGGELYGPPQ